MAQLNDDCFVIGDALTPAAEALTRLEQTIQPVADAETILLRAATGRVLARDIISAHDVPPHDNAAVDGYAVYFDDLNTDGETRLPLIGRATAGHPMTGPAAAGAAIRIFTGAAILPEADGTAPDTVFMQEDCKDDGSHVVVPSGIYRGANKRARGEDVRAGDTILETGHRLRPQDVGLAAAIGQTHLEVYRRLKVAVFSTGDEVFEPGASLPPGGIYDANRFTIAGLVESLGCEVNDLGILADDRSTVTDALREAAGHHDVLLTSGGVSVGEEDHVKAAVEDLGQLHFWRLAIRPGRPIAFGQINQVPFVGLPGNPVAVMVTFLRFARPMILRLGGCRDVTPQHYRVRAAFDYRKKPGRREWLRARLVRTEEGTLTAEKYSSDGAGVLSSAVFADGLIEVAEDVTELKTGSYVEFLPFNEMMR
jgi:molybdopterin molybdotransferase